MATIIRPEPPGKGVFVSDRRLYLDALGNVVETNNPAKRTLLVAAGCTLPLETARKYGLVKDAEPEIAPVPPVVEAPVIEAEPETAAEVAEAPEPVVEKPKPAAKPRKTAKAAKPAKK